jgi:aldose sugar dehydrogenase
MNKFGLQIFGISLVIALTFLYHVNYPKLVPTEQNAEATENPERIPENDDKPDIPENLTNDEIIIAENLNIPWDMVLLPDDSILLTERPGKLRKFGGNELTLDIPEVAHIGEGGLLGIALHPDFENNNWFYLYFTTRNNGQISNSVVRYTLTENSIIDKKSIIENIPGAQNHNGGRIAFGPDGYLYIATGDAQNPDWAQDLGSLAGKILRLKDDGQIPEDNPYSSAIYSYGHRNVQGLAWDSEGRLWATEHGRSGALSGLDELNQIKIGANYGWPIIEGDKKQAGMESPARHSGTNDTWAPSGATFFDGSIYFVGLRGQALYEAVLDRDGQVIDLKTHFKNKYGRLRQVASTREALYLLSSNTDGRGRPDENDDKLIRIGWGW